MKPKLVLGMAIVMVTGCHDLGPPTTVDVRPPTAMMIAVSDMINDPLVSELVASIGDQKTAAEVADLLSRASAAAKEGDTRAILRNLMIASDRVMSDSNAEDAALRAALMFQFDEARLSLRQR